MTEAECQRLLDEEHLRLLRLGYLITGAVSAVFSPLPLLYAGIAVAFVPAFAAQAPGPSGCAGTARCA